MVRTSKAPHFKTKRAASINPPLYFRKVSEGVTQILSSEQALAGSGGNSVGRMDKRVISVGIQNGTYLKAQSY